MLFIAESVTGKKLAKNTPPFSFKTDPAHSDYFVSDLNSVCLSVIPAVL